MSDPEDRTQPLQDTPVEPPTFSSDMNEIRAKLSYVLLFASIPGLSIPGIIAKLLHVDDVLTLWQLIVATAPLTCAVTAVGTAYLSGKYDFGQLLFGTGAALFASLLLGDVLGRLSPIAPRQELGALPFAILRILSGYLELYGAWSFASSFVVGGFLAWAWSKKIWPRLNQQATKA
ncbi:hypothetical protein ACYOEI_24830 [Singulisphaera rosea]